jgi:hypothetical protein
MVSFEVPLVLLATVTHVEPPAQVAACAAITTRFLRE